MADAAVEFLLNNLGQLLRYHAHLIKDAKNQVEKLEKDLRLFKAFLKDSAKKRRKDDTLRELVRQIRDVVYMAEDTIDAFVTQAADIRSKNFFTRSWRTPLSLHDIATRVEAISREVNDIYKDKTKFDLANFDIKDGGPQLSQPPVLGQQNVVGFEDEAEKIIGYLREQRNQLDVISVIGMPGLGKTTLTWKIFHDEAIQYEFPTRIWVYVSQEFTRKNVYLAILKEFITNTEEMYKKSDQELAELVFRHLETGKFLIVMDDVWADHDWDEIKVALPRNNVGGKVIITSRSEEVARHANQLRDPHNLRFLTQDESWLLLQLEALGKPDCPSELENLGKLIAKRCAGLPLAIVIIGGILSKSFSKSDDLSKKRTAWEKVSKSVGKYVAEDPQNRMENIIALSYDKLPYHLRACFLYLGMFPEDFEIPVWKLTRMWIAEGFIQQEDDIRPEETAENYLDQLIHRNLVKADKRRHDGRVKTCRIHDMLRDFCKKEAGNDRDNFLQEIKTSSEGLASVDEVRNYRRICIHSNVTKFLSLKPEGPQVRSFACFAKEDISLPTENTSAIPAGFKLLRVLDVKPVKFRKIPSDMYQLVHLRYITLSLDAGSLPAAFAKLWNMQTLIVDTTYRTLEIKVDIWKLRQLRHLKTNASASLPKVEKDSKEGEKLQTLGKISPESCTEQVFDRARNIKKLGIRGKLDLFLQGKTISFDSVGKLESLENLKLLNDVFPNPASEQRLRGLPPIHQFPPKLKSLTLSNTFLDWVHMSTLALLEKLEVLKLKQNAFMGSTWEPKDAGFRCLELLHLDHTDLVCWKASSNHFPRLRHLRVHNCENLVEIPFGLADAPNFRLLNLYRSTNAAKSAKKIRDAKKNIIDGGEFKLTIFPPDE